MTDTASKDPGIWTVPNQLTFFRVAAAPATALCFALMDRPAADMIAFVLFVLAAITDFFDGWIARAWNQTSALGRMLDPVADKAMVIVAFAAIIAVRGTDPLILVPAAAILTRETLVSGLREALAGRAVIHVTVLAKWKTTAQMVALGLLLLAGYAGKKRDFLYYELPPDMYDAMLTGAEPDLFAVGFWAWVAPALEWGGIACLWVAAALTVITGVDYMRKGVGRLLRG